jgi:hypothetical protein
VTLPLVFILSKASLEKVYFQKLLRFVFDPALEHGQDGGRDGANMVSPISTEL